MRPLFAALLLALLPLAAVPAAPPPPKPAAGFPRVRILTSEGPIVIALDTKRAPATSANFLTYADDGRLDGTTFYRAARRKSDPKLGFVQGGIGNDLRRALPPVPLEKTSQTGILHLDATVSMARGDRPGSAMGNFFITVGPTPSMDARGDYEGYAAFAHVVSGMETVRRILAKPSGGGTDAMKGQMIFDPVKIISVKRMDGVPKPSGWPKPWLIDVPRRQ